MRKEVAFALALVAGALFVWGPATAAADLSSDYLRVRADWQAHHGKITRCRFTEAELSNVLTAISANPDENYSDFRPAVEGELARIKAKLCSGTVAESARRRSPLDPATISKIKGKGGPKQELVVLSNSSKNKLSLKGATLRNRAGRKLKLPKHATIAPRGKLTVRTGCGRARGGTVFACTKKGFWDDKGDVVSLYDRSKVAAAQAGFGKFEAVYRF
jgi:lamin tail-like protein